LASEEEFEEFVAGALPRLLRFAHVLTGDSAAAEDLVQTALGRSWRAWRSGRIDDPQAFVRKVMVNSNASWHRRHGRRETAFANPPETVIAEDEAGRIDDRDAMRRALLTLPPRQRAPGRCGTLHKVSPPSWASYSPTWTAGGKIVFRRVMCAPTQSADAPASAYIVNRNGSGLRLLYPKLDATQIAWGAATLPRVTC
jgi:Sigma-70 region 2